jgi:ABC-type multidrug transport system permease subunit
VLASAYLVIWFLAVISMAIGILVSNVARTEGQVIPFIPLVIVPSFLFAGLVVAVDRLPAWAQVISRISPMYYANNVLQELIAGERLTSDVLSFVALPAYAIIALLLAAVTLREQH